MFDVIINFWYFWVIIVVLLLYQVFKSYIKGFIGEKVISALLLRLDSDKYKVINNLMVEAGGKTSQIDHVFVSVYGIFVIETKNYTGWIFGDERSKYWTQVIYKNKERFYNPLRQNYGHVKALNEVLDGYDESIFIPLVVFSIQSTLKDSVPPQVIYSTELVRRIKSYQNQLLSEHDMESIYHKLASLNITDQERKKEHVESIKQQKQKGKQNKTFCPSCGGQLKSRKGKYGYFKGCSNYPKCKYTA